MKLHKISLCFSLLLLFSSCSNTVKEHTETSLVPLGASVIVKVNSTERAALLADSSGIEALQTLPFERLANTASGTWIGALVPSGADKMDWLWSTSFQQETTQWNTIEEYVVTPWDSVYIVRAGNTIAWSENQGSLQDLINQYNNGSDIQQNAAFKKLWTNASSGDELNVFLQHSELELVGDQFFQTDLSWAKHLASWSELDITLRKSNLIITSVSLSSDSSNTFLSTFNQRAKDVEYSNAIASSASYVLTMNTGKPTEWMRDFNRYRGKKQRLKKATSLLEAAGVDAMQATTLISGAMFRAGYGEEAVLGIELSDATAMKDALEKISSTSTVWQGLERGTLQEKHKFLFSSLLGWFFSDLGTPSWLIHENWLLIAQDPNTLEVYAGELKLDQHWEASPYFDAFADHINGTAHFNVALPLTLAEEKGLISGVSEGNWSRMRVMASLNVKEDLAFGNITLTKPEEEAEEQSTYVWSTALEAEVSKGPWLVQNHRSGKNNVLVQDVQHTLYWLDENGTINWKKTLEGPVVGEVQQVDMFKNKKYQLLLTTTNQLHCIDLLGRNVEAFPITLPEPTTLGVAVMDYEKNRNYRYLIPCGTHIYNYGSDGSIISGWKTDLGKGTITQLPALFQKNGKDYIITSTATTPLILNRKGEIRIQTKSFEPSLNEWYLLEGSVPSIVRLSDKNALQYQKWDGSTSTEELVTQNTIGIRVEDYGRVIWNEDYVYVSSDTRSFDFELEDITRVDTYPGGTAVIFTSQNLLSVVNLHSNETINNFNGTIAKAGRFTQTSLPSIIIGRSNTIINFQL